MSETWKRVSGWTEGGDDDDLPKFGRKARAWFTRLLRDKLEEIGLGYPYMMTKVEIEPMVAWFADDPMRFVVWSDAEEYRGRGWSTGAWQIDWDVVKSTLPGAIEALRIENDTAAITSLDDWLRADLAGSLRSEGARGGTGKLPKKLLRELRAAARERRRGMPKSCTTCKEPFKPTSNRQRRCQKCIAAGTCEIGARRNSQRS